MFRRFRHKLLLYLQAGILLSGAVGVALYPAAWQAILIATLGSSLTAHVCHRIARQYLHTTLGRLRHVAEDIGRGASADALQTQPGDDMYKLNRAIQLVAARLATAAREERRLHDELRRRERLAFLGELAASVAHEVNNPLDGVQNCVRILRRAQGDPRRAAEMLDLIEGGLERIELIVRRLLTLAREHVIRPTPTSLASVIDGALTVVGAKLESHCVRLERNYLPAGQDVAPVDRPLLEGVFVNLALNALDSMPAGGELSFSVRRDPRPARADGDAPGVDLCVDVADSGDGIAPDVVPHIFEPFFTTKTGGKGTGLGLALAARIVDAHRGVITVAPRGGGGSVFTVRLPACAADEVPAAESSTVQPASVA
ncbi:MAG: hypothetical protein IPM13_03990 [Phycisphaerales bacterium]|nr:hypothetical protein [Phycisphaerales bacterium]